MSLTLFTRFQAKSDIVEMADHIAQDSLESAEAFIAAVEATLLLLAEMPGVGATREYQDPALFGLRIWPVQGFGRYLIFYREVSGRLEVVRVLHAARNIAQLFEPETD